MPSVSDKKFTGAIENTRNHNGVKSQHSVTIQLQVTRFCWSLTEISAQRGYIVPYKLVSLNGWRH